VALHLFSGLLVDGSLGALDETEDVPHPEDAGSHALRVEYLEVLRALARPGEADPLAGREAQRKGGAAAFVAVELGLDHAVETDRGCERLPHLDRFLARHGVGD